jgi:NIMA (never in mitosis gene a)-related kinase
MDKKEIQNTLNEIRILSSIQNENICGYREAFITKNGKEMNIVMEFVGGGDLSMLISTLKKKGKKLNEEIVWKYLC